MNNETATKNLTAVLIHEYIHMLSNKDSGFFITQKMLWYYHNIQRNRLLIISILPRPFYNMQPPHIHQRR